MDIGLPLRTLALGTPGTGAPAPEPLAPLAGILEADTVIVLGASIMRATWALPVHDNLQTFAAALGFTGTLVTYAQSGDDLADTIVKQATAKAEQSATEGSNLYLVHSGGNNVSGPRPYPGGAAIFQTDYTTLMDNITATDKVIPLPLTKRLYGINDVGYPDNPEDVVHGVPASEANGSLPYNENIIYPAINSYAPDWLDANGVPFVNPYEVVERHPDLLSDAVHGYGQSLSRFILTRVAARAKGLVKGAPRAGKSLIYSIEQGAANTMEIGPINRFRSNRNFSGYPVLYGSIFSDGSLDGFVSVRTSDEYRNSTSTDGTQAYPRIADTRFHSPDILDEGIYFEAGDVYTLTFYDLNPGETVTVSCCGIRSAGGTARRADVTLTGGQTLELDASNIAASNQIVFAPIVIPADGQITLSLQISSGSNYGYLHGVILDFS